MDEKQFLEILVKRYADNALTPEEETAFFYLLRQGKLDAILERHLDLEKIESLVPDKKRSRSGTFSGKYEIVRVAASFIILMAIGLALFTGRQKIYRMLGKTYFVTIETHKGEKQVVNLPDGSTVWLNESSILQYPSVFDNQVRTVSLIEGEAYFDVKRDEHKPFSVEAAGTKTNVLGTAFNIRSYRYMQNVQVTVTRGKVAVENAKSGHSISVTKILLPNEQASFNSQTNEIKKIQVNGANAVAWREGRLLFDNERFDDIITVLENKFEVHISFTDESIKDYKISAEFISSDSLDHVLGLLSMANNLDYQIEEDNITISRKRKPAFTSPLPM